MKVTTSGFKLNNFILSSISSADAKCPFLTYPSIIVAKVTTFGFKLKLKQIFFGHNAIWDYFGSHNRVFRRKTIYETITELNERQIDPTDLWQELNLIEVMNKDGRYYATGGNRRLYCLKNSKRFSPESRIHVNEILWDPILAAKNINTQSNGKTVEIRTPNAAWLQKQYRLWNNEFIYKNLYHELHLDQRQLQFKHLIYHIIFERWL